MIDLHCHLLPGVDDGPETLEEALAMARLAVANGITEARVTPHVHVGRWDNDLEGIHKAVEAHRVQLALAGIPLKLGFAAEVRLSYEVLPLIEAGRVPFLGEFEGYKVMLLEFPHSHIPVGSDKFVAWLLQRGIRPMIAHPERNKEIMRDAGKVRPFVLADCMLQLTADAVAGEFGEVCEARAIEFLERGWVTVLASDAHDVESRPPRIAPGLEVAAGILGAEAAQMLVEGNPRRILYGA